MTATAVAWFDSHCHVQPGHGAESLEAADALVERAHDAGVAWMVCVGTDLETSMLALELAGRHPNVFATVGLHPHDASKLTMQWDQLQALADDDRAVGVGEAGFDLHYEYSPRDAQEVAFRSHIRLAKQLDRALIIHSREAWDDTFRVLEDEGVPARTVFHCFTGGPAEARRAIDLGAHLSFSGIVSFRSADDLRAAAAITPDDRLLVETDSPYLTPEPHRGRPNEPALVPLVGAALAAARGTDDETIAALTRENARRVFDVPLR
jgi:TatD DNase family protein